MRSLWIPLAVFLAVVMGLQANTLVVYKGKLKIKYRGAGESDTVSRDVIIIRDLGDNDEDPDDDDEVTFLINKDSKVYFVEDQFHVDDWIASDNGKQDIEVVELDIQVIIHNVEGGVLQVDEDGAAFVTGQVKTVKTSKTDSVQVIRVIKKKGHLELEDTSLGGGPTPADHDTIVGVGEFQLSVRVDNGRTRDFNDPEGPVDGELIEASEAILNELEDDGYSDGDE